MSSKYARSKIRASNSIEGLKQVKYLTCLDEHVE